MEEGHRVLNAMEPYCCCACCGVSIGMGKKESV